MSGSTSRDVGKLISMVGLHFPPPKFPDDQAEAAWSASMVRFLAPYSPEVLAKAAEHIIQTRDPTRHGQRWFPAPAEIIAVCNTMRAVVDAGRTPLLTSGRRDPSEWAGWRRDLADELVRNSDLGREAARGGWVQALWDFCRRRGALPRTQSELVEVRGHARDFDKALDVLRRGQGGAFNAPLLSLGEAMLDKRNERARKVLEGASQ